MKLRDVRIRGFRSVEEVELTDIGSLNVLIGKNNAGKSTILTAIETFFSCIKGGKIVSLSPPIGRMIDLHRTPPANAINITLTFALSPSQRQQLQAEISNAAPQVRAATGVLDHGAALRANLVIAGDRERYACINALELIPLGADAQLIRRLVIISDKAAEELAARQRTVRSLTDVIESLDRFWHGFDEDDFKRAKAESDTRGSVMRFTLMRTRYLGENNPRSLEAIEGLVKASGSHAELRSNINSYKDQISEDIKKAEKEPIENFVETFSGEEHSIPPYVSSIVSRIAELRLLYLTERREPVGRAEATQLLQYKVTRGGTETLKEIQTTIDNLLGVQLDAFENPQLARSERIAEMDVDNFLLEVNGSGIKEALRLVLDVEFKKPDILLVEEPEVHLHPALETNMMRYLRSKSDNCQLFLSTHSTNFLDSSEMKNVYFISKPGPRTEVQLMNMHEAETTLPRELGIRLSSLFMFDRIAFVEGPTDEAVLREMAALLGINLSYANVGFIKMGGVRNFAHYATETIFNFLTKRQVRLWFILDRDERDDADLKAMNDRLGGKAITKFLAKRELENYLVLARPLTAFINWKLLASPSGLPKADETAVKAVIEEEAEKLKFLAIGKRAAKAICHSLHPDLQWEDEESLETLAAKLKTEFAKMHEGISAAEMRVDQSIQQAKDSLEAEWVRSKLSLVPGDLLLDAVCKRFGARFKKASDSVRLASMLEVSEVDPDIARTLKELVS